MKDLKKKLESLLKNSKYFLWIKKNWVIFAIIFLVSIYFYPIFKGLLPIPADIISGLYFPWYDMKFAGFPAGVPVDNPLPSDVVSLTYPLRELSIGLMKKGEWPLWNAYILSGTPLLANFQSAALYPLNIIYFFISNFSYAWSAQVILQTVLGFLFMYWFLRSHQLSSVASFYGGIVWGFGGFFSIWLEYNTLIHALLFLPLALLAIKKIKQKRIYGFLFSLAISFSLYGGNPPMTLIVLFASGLYSIWEYRKKWSLYYYLLLFFIIGLGLAAPLLFPGYETLIVSIRKFDTIAKSAAIKYLSLPNLLSIVSPDIFGNPATGNYWFPRGFYDNLTAYVGVVPIVLFLTSFWLRLKKKSNLIHFAWLVFFTALLLSLKNPILGWVGNIKFLGISAMVMTRFVSLISFSVAVVCACVFDETIRKKSTRIWKTPFLIVFLLIAGPLLFFSISHLRFGDKNSLISIHNLIFPLAIFIAFSLSAFLRIRLEKIRPLRKFVNLLFPFLIILLTFFELGRFHLKYNSFSPPQLLYPKNEVVDYLLRAGGRFDRERGEIIPPNMWLPYRLRSASGYDTTHSLRYNRFISLINMGTLQSNPGRYVEVTNFDSPLVNFLGISNVAAIKRIAREISFKGEAADSLRLDNFKKVYEKDRVVILENDDAFPIVYPVTGYVLAKSDQDFEAQFKAVDLSKTAILEKDPKMSIEDGSVSLKKINLLPQSLQVVTSAQKPFLLVTSQTYDTGWKLKIDGNKSEILRANYAFMAIPVPSGTHNIKFYYQPLSFIVGLAFFILSLLLSVIVVLSNRSKRVWLIKKLT